MVHVTVTIGRGHGDGYTLVTFPMLIRPVICLVKTVRIQQCDRSRLLSRLLRSRRQKPLAELGAMETGSFFCWSTSAVSRLARV